MKSLFKTLSFDGVPFIRDIADGIRFREMIGGFASKVLSAREPVRIVTPATTITGRCLSEDGVVYLEIGVMTGKQEEAWALRLDRYQCRVIFSILGRILGECEFPYP